MIYLTNDDFDQAVYFEVRKSEPRRRTGGDGARPLRPARQRGHGGAGHGAQLVRLGGGRVRPGRPVPFRGRADAAADAWCRGAGDAAALARLLKNSHLAAVLASRLVRRGAVYARRVLRLRGREWSAAS